MTLEHLKNYIKTWVWTDAGGSEPLCIAIGAIDANRERCVGVYPGRSPARQRVCLGGAEATLTGELYATVLVHWGKNMREAMEKAAEIYALFYAWDAGAVRADHAGGGNSEGDRNGASGGVRNGIKRPSAGGEMDGVRVYAVEPGGGPVPVGRDAHGVCEFVINLKITFEKECVR